MQGKSGLITYGITPPKRSTSEERRREIAERQSQRIQGLPLDGLIVYDIQDESARTSAPRPFPYLEAIDPGEYAYDYLQAVELPKVVYRCVASMEPAELQRSLGRLQDNAGLSVFVGAASRTSKRLQELSEAHALRRQQFRDVPVGGVLIAERHAATRNEHERVLAKVDQGCSFFVSQAVYSAVDTKNVLSDLYYACERAGRQVPPVLVTLTPCGSTKTLEFLGWLGVSLPHWLENELVHAHDILETSVDLCTEAFAGLLDFARDKGIPLGCNVESVSLRKQEIDASVELLHRVARLLGKDAPKA